MNKQPQEDYQKKAKEIFRILNDIRKNPNLIIRHLERLKSYFDPHTKILAEPKKIRIQMVEDISVFDDAIQFLSELEPLEPLHWDENLALSALEHVLDIGPKGLLRFESSDGTSVEDRIKKYGNYIEHLGESIDYGPNDAMGVLVSLILDDGEAEKPDRYNLFRSDYMKLGIACGPHKTEYQITVFDFAYDFVGHEDNDMEGEEFIEFSQNKIDPDITQNISINNGNSGIKNVSDVNFPDNVRGNLNLNKSGVIRVPTDGNQLKQNETDGEISDIGDLNKLKLNQKNPNEASNANNFKRKIEENKEAKIQSENLQRQQNEFPKSKSTNTGFVNKNKQNGDLLERPEHDFKENKNSVLEKHNPLVKLSLDKDPKIYSDEINSGFNNEDLDLMTNNIKIMNLEKKIVSKTVEVTTKIIYTFNDGSTREVVEKNNHIYKFD